MGKLDIPYAERITTVHNNTSWFQWCCDCGLRHMYHFRIVRGETPADDRVEFTIERDDWATLARKTITRLKKKIKILKGK